VASKAPGCHPTRMITVDRCRICLLRAKGLAGKSTPYKQTRAKGHEITQSQHTDQDDPLAATSIISKVKASFTSTRNNHSSCERLFCLPSHPWLPCTHPRGTRPGQARSRLRRRAAGLISPTEQRRRPRAPTHRGRTASGTRRRRAAGAQEEGAAASSTRSCVPRRSSTRHDPIAVYHGQWTP
jgi:hypothetical protein